MAIDYRRYEMELYKVIVQLEEILKGEIEQPWFGQWLEELGEAQERIQNRRFRVAVVGEFNCGKTSFINALLGERILPEDIEPTTATINRITYGDAPKARLVMKDGSVTSVEIGELAGFVTKLTKSSADAAGKIEEAVVEYPSFFCRNEVDLIDTPGMNDMDDMNEVTLGQLKRIDLAIVAVNIRYPYSETENSFVLRLLESPQIYQIIFVATHTDQLRERDRERVFSYLNDRIRTNLLEKIRQNYEDGHAIFEKYHFIFDDLQIFGISSPDAIDALKTNDMELYDKSGFTELNERLPKLILKSQAGGIVQSGIESVKRVLRSYAVWLDSGRGYEEIVRQAGEFTREWDRLAIPERVKEDVFGSMAWKAPNVVRAAVLEALGTLPGLDAASVKKALVPVLERQFRSVNLSYKTDVEAALQKCDEFIKERSMMSARAVRKRLEQWPDAARKAVDSLLELYNHMRSLEDREERREPEMFFWTSSIVDAVLNTPVNQSVVPAVDRIVAESRQDYEKRRKAQLQRYFLQAETEWHREITRIIKSWDVIFGEYKGQSGQNEQKKRRAKEMEQTLRQMERNFREELRKGE